MPPTSSDESILQKAYNADEIIITHDTDFGKLLSFKNTAKPSVILFRIDKINAGFFFKLLHENWLSIETILTEGAFVVFEKDKLRTRKLPFWSTN